MKQSILFVCIAAICFGSVAEISAAPALNELLASNLNINTDPDFGETGDWVELCNPGAGPIALSDYALSDDPSTHAKWLFPAGATINAGEYLIIWLDGYDTQGAALHANFRLSSDGETLTLYDTNASTITDQIEFPEQISDFSYARFPDATGVWEVTKQPTPGTTNVIVQNGPSPTFSVPSGIYSTPQTVEITAQDATQIRYTTNGDEPNGTSSVYSTPLNINSYTGLRARAWYSDKDPSDVTSASYFFNMPGNRQIPILDIVIPDDSLFDSTTGIYVNYEERGPEWERLAHFTFLSPDGAQVIESQAGLRIHGGYSRGQAKKSLRMYFRPEYGDRAISLPWMERTPLDEVRQVVLRAAANDGFLVSVTSQLDQATLIRDQIMRDWYGEMGARAADGFFVALYLNGEYWGLYNATERITNDFLEDTYGGEEWDVVKGTWTYETKFFTEATDGDLIAWNEFLAWIDASDIATPGDYAALMKKIDLQNFVDYFALNIICQNEDWPHNNWIASRRKDDPAAQWTFHEWDSEWGIGLRPNGWMSDTIKWAQGDNFHLSPSHNGTLAPLCLLFNGNDLAPSPPSTINGILDNPDGKSAFLAAMDDALNFELRTEKTLADFNAYVAVLENEIPREAARWAANSKYSESKLITTWNSAVGNLRDFLTNRPDFIRNLTVSKFAINGVGILTLNPLGSGTGRVIVNGHEVDLPWTGKFFAGNQITLTAKPDFGNSFTQWSGAIQSNDEQITGTAFVGTINLNVTFETIPGIVKPNDVIINEYWINDDETTYSTIEGRAIDGDWIELLVVRDNMDLRGWRLTNNTSLAQIGTIDDGNGSLIFPWYDGLTSLQAGTIVLIIASDNAANDAAFPIDDYDVSDRRIIMYRGNDGLDSTTDPGFSVRTSNEAITLLAPGDTGNFHDDIGVDFIAEGSDVTPAGFGIADHGVVFTPSFIGIGDNDGAIFTNDPQGGLNNDNGEDPDRTDALPGFGGWIVDAPKQFTGDDIGAINILTPGAANIGQNISALIGPEQYGWMLY